MKLVATVQKLTTEALGATELGHMGCFSQWCCFTGHDVFGLSDFVFTDAQQIMESSAL